MGFRGKYKNKRDANEPEVFDALRDAGMMVYPTDKPLDAVVCYLDINILLEVKNGPRAPLTKAQKAFLQDWTGLTAVLTSQEEARVWAEEITATYGPQKDTWQSIGDLAANMVKGQIK